MNTSKRNPELDGVAKVFDFSSVTSNPDLVPFMGKKVQYKPEILTPKFLKQNGSICISGIWEVREVQKTYDGTEVLRGYEINDEHQFGRPIHPDHIEIVQ